MCFRRGVQNLDIRKKTWQPDDFTSVRARNLSLDRPPVPLSAPRSHVRRPVPRSAPGHTFGAEQSGREPPEPSEMLRKEETRWRAREWTVRKESPIRAGCFEAANQRTPLRNPSVEDRTMTRECVRPRRASCRARYREEPRASCRAHRRAEPRASCRARRLSRATSELPRTPPRRTTSELPRTPPRRTMSELPRTPPEQSHERAAAHAAEKNHKRAAAHAAEKNRERAAAHAAKRNHERNHE